METRRDGGASEQPVGHTGGPGAQRLAGIWAVGRVACTPGRPACRTVGLGLPNAPARRREGEATTSHHQVRLFAQAQACGAETLGRTANRGSGGAGKGSSPAFPLKFIPPLAFQVLERRAEGGEAGSGCGNPEGVSFPGLCCCFQAAPASATKGTIAEGWCAKNVS